jgi:hypothetical protein
VYIKSTYRGQNPLGYATYNDYHLTINNTIGGSLAVLPNGLAMSYGDVHYDTLQFCAVVGDTVYFALNSSSVFEYELSYEVVSTGLPANDVEPNNCFITATPITYNGLMQGMIKTLTYSPSGATDFEDYYKAILPTNGKLKLIFIGSNISCNNSNAITVEVLRDGPFSTPPIQPAYTVGDTLYYCSVVADTVFFKLSSLYPSAYSIKYEMMDTTIVNDVEPNNATLQAIPVAKGDTRKGTLSYKNHFFTDVNDYYRVIFDCSDTLKLTSIFQNQSCDFINNFYVGTAIRLYNKNGTLINSKGIPNLTSNQIYYDTTSFPINVADTFYINYSQIDLGSNIASLSYEFSVKNTAPSSAFIITGPDSSCFGTKIYNAQNICNTGNTYHWSLSGGGTLSAVDSIATVNWTTSGTHTISLYMSNAYGNTITKQYTVTVVAPLPATVPVLTANGRNLKVTTAPPEATYQWYRNNNIITGANDSTYSL